MQLLAGLQDENDTIVAATFQSLSNIVPILGCQTVVGSQGSKIFFDRKPDVSCKYLYGLYCLMLVYIEFLNLYFKGKLFSRKSHLLSLMCFYLVKNNLL